MGILALRVYDYSSSPYEILIVFSEKIKKCIFL